MVPGAGATGSGASGGLSSADLVVVGCTAAVTAVAVGGALLLWRARKLRRAAKKGQVRNQADVL